MPRHAKPAFATIIHNYPEASTSPQEFPGMEGTSAKVTLKQANVANKKLLNYIQNPEETVNFCSKEFLKIYITDILQLSYSDLSGLHRTALYEYTKQQLKYFKREPTTKSLMAVNAFMTARLQCKLANLRKKCKDEEELKKKKGLHRPLHEGTVDLDDVDDADDSRVLESPSKKPVPTGVNTPGETSATDVVVEIDRDETPPPPEDLCQSATSNKEPMDGNSDDDEAPMVIDIDDVPVDAVTAVVLESPPTPRPETEESAVVAPPPKKRKKTKPNVSSQRSVNIVSMISQKTRQENAIRLHATPHLVRGLKFKIDLDACTLNASEGKEASYTEFMNQPSEEQLDFEKLLFWSDVCFHLNVPGQILEISRTTLLNNTQELVKRSGEYEPPRKNSMDLHRFYKNQTFRSVRPPEKDIELSHGLIELYILLVIKVVEISTHPKTHDFLLVLNLILTDIQKLKRIFLDANYGYFLSRSKYVRRFRQNKKGNDDDDLELIVEETINPEVVFTVHRSLISSDENQLIDYFSHFLEQKNEAAIKEFMCQLSKGLSVKCYECNYTVSGAMATFMMGKHLRGFCNVPFECTDENCKFSATEDVLSKQGWSHKCVGDK